MIESFGILMFSESVKEEDLPYLLALHSIDGLGPVRLRKLLEFAQASDVWRGDFLDFKSLGIPEQVILRMKEARFKVDPWKMWEEVRSSGVGIVTLFDDDYPLRLKDIYDPPVVLYFKGRLGQCVEPAVGVVGTRKVTSYGQFVTERICEELSERGVVIVSGLARGVDSVAHRSTVRAGGRTLAVLGGGINKIFPPENTKLSEDVVLSGGAIVSEFPPDFPHLPGNFPSRNRIIAGLSMGVLVTEAAIDSGSMITARLGLEYGREVLAVPGPITSTFSMGPLSLIKFGAGIVTSAADVMEALGLKVGPTIARVSVNLSEFERQILSTLGGGAKHVDEISRFLGVGVAEVSASLVKMEIVGVVRNLGGGNFSCAI